MNPDTPLEEVAQHLPTEAASRLDQAPHETQVAVLAHVRTVVVYWETQNYTFDPIEYEGILNALVASYTPMLQEIIKLRGDVLVLSSRLAGAELLVESLSGSLAQMQDLNPPGVDT